MRKVLIIGIKGGSHRFVVEAVNSEGIHSFPSDEVHLDIAINTVPVGLRLAQRGSPGGVAVQWAPFPGAVKYNIHRRINGGPYEYVMTTNGPIFGEYITGHQDGVTYTYAVTAINGSGIETLKSFPASIDYRGTFASDTAAFEIE